MTTNKALNTKVDKFLTSYAKLKKTATAVVLEAVLHWNEHGDWTNLAKIIANVDQRMAKHVKMVIRTLMPGATLQADKDATYGLKLGRKGTDSFSQEKADELAAFISSEIPVNYAIDGELILEWAGVTKPEKKDPELLKVAEVLAKRMLKYEWTEAALVAAVQEALRKEREKAR